MGVRLGRERGWEPVLVWMPVRVPVPVRVRVLAPNVLGLGL